MDKNNVLLGFLIVLAAIGAASFTGFLLAIAVDTFRLTFNWLERSKRWRQGTQEKSNAQ